MPGKSVHEIVEEAYNKLVELKPTVEEIAEYAKEAEKEYGVVTHSISRRNGNLYFLRFHDTWGLKQGGRVHIDIGYVNEETKIKNDNAQYRDIYDTTHLMLNKDFVQDFINFIIQKRKKVLPI
jgi:hypothetical protein